MTDLDARIRARLDSDLDPLNGETDALLAVLDHIKEAEEYGDRIEAKDIRHVIAKEMGVSSA